jgi:hypothetical protein
MLAWFLIFEHRILEAPPFLGLMSIFSKWNPSHGVDALQCMPTATLYRLVPVMFCQRTSLILRRDESQFWYESVAAALVLLDVG